MFVPMFVRSLAAASFLLFTGQALADSLDLNLSNHDASFVYGRSYRAAEITAGALYANKNSYSDSHWAGHLGLLATGEQRTSRSRVEAGVGGRLYGVTAEGKDAFGLALGGGFRWFPGDAPLGLGAYGFFAPDIVTGLDAKRLWEAGARVELEVARGTAYAYLGYRKMEMRLKNDSDVNIDQGAHVGVRIVF